MFAPALFRRQIGARIDGSDAQHTDDAARCLERHVAHRCRRERIGAAAGSLPLLESPRGHRQFVLILHKIGAGCSRLQLIAERQQDDRLPTEGLVDVPDHELQNVVQCAGRSQIAAELIERDGLPLSSGDMSRLDGRTRVYMEEDESRVHPLFENMMVAPHLYGIQQASWRELLWEGGREMFGRNFSLPRWLDLPLRSLKYVLFGLFFYAIAQMSTADLQAFMHTPYGLVADVKMLDFFRLMGRTSAIVIAVLLVMSVFVKNAWCRYLCPYGAMLGLVALVSPTRIRRTADACIDCGKCAKACPSLLPVDKLASVRSAECTNCLLCITACPSRDALQCSTARRWALPGWAVAAGVLGVVGQPARFGNDQFGLAMGAPDADRQIGKHDAQEATGPGQRFGQTGGAEATAAEKFEAADAHGLGEQGEAFVVQQAVQAVVQRRVALDGNPAGGVCNINVDGCQERSGVNVPPRQAGQHSGNKSHGNSGLRSAGEWRGGG